MREETKRDFLALWDGQEAALVGRATDWVIHAAVDLQGKRPREETEALVRRAHAAYRRYLLEDDYRPLGQLVAHVVELRGDLLFQLSTPQRGFHSLVVAARELLQAGALPPERALELLVALDEAYARVLHELSDAYQAKVTARLRALAERAEQASRAKSDFLVSLSHEIRSSLNSILGFSQLLSTRPLTGIPESQEYLASVGTAARVLSALLDNVLDLSRIEAGRMSVQEEAIDLRRLVQGVFEVHRAQALERGVRFAYLVDPSLPRYVRADGRKLNQILTNLTTNALKFTPRGRTVELSARRTAEGALALVVRDEGVGIAPEWQERIFEPFVQARSEARGSGLGLAITRSLVTLLGGRVTLESAPQAGSTFTATLPLVEASSLVEAMEGIDWREHRLPPGRRALVVAPADTDRRLLEIVLGELGVQTRSVEAPAAAEAALAFRPQVVLYDLPSSGLDEAAVLPLSAGAAVLVISADARGSTRERALAAGASEFLPKPVDIRHLVALLVARLGEGSLRAD